MLPGEENFNQVEIEENIPQELLRYLKQQTLMVPLPISEMQRIQNNKRKRPQSAKFVNYLDYEPKKTSR